MSIPDNGIEWRKSGRSGTGTNCVEVASADQRFFFRDTKDRRAGYLEFSRKAWTAFLANGLDNHG
jgi:hypothetical protein